MSFVLVPKLVTLNGIMACYDHSVEVTDLR